MKNIFEKNLIYIFDRYDVEENPALDKLRKKFSRGKKLDVRLVYEAIKPLGLTIDELFEIELQIKYKKELQIKFLVTDVDGVLTNGGVYIDVDGREIKRYNVKDGFGIKQLTSRGFPVGFLSAGYNPSIVQARANMLGVQYVYVGQEQKIDILRKWCSQLNISLSNVAYVGDDMNDLEIIKNVGLSACPDDANPYIKMRVDYIIPHNGGEAAVRWFIDNILSKYI